MVFFDMLLWWYGTAWVETLQAIQKRAATIFETFSIGLLARTLFSPFRQIDAGRVRGPIDVQLRSWFDRTFSRFFGAIVRSVMIVFGLLVLGAVFITSIAWAAIWLIIPILPVIGLIMALVG